ncbi:unnamed protein product [Pleuronectes platessa]|uniref:Uncharacterized protein n=1 Tax=Pleuronectes platessa TaxID=8262 RepID=A0A9N7YZT3_PLEPL|nr:unnamed protein product [Pleuronectes platessa]
MVERRRLEDYGPQHKEKCLTSHDRVNLEESEEQSHTGEEPRGLVLLLTGHEMPFSERAVTDPSSNHPEQRKEHQSSSRATRSRGRARREVENLPLTATAQGDCFSASAPQTFRGITERRVDRACQNFVNTSTHGRS